MSDMSNFDVARINLNLIPALSALLSEGSVGRAARRVGVSQSAMSHSLARLRELFDDPLLVSQGRTMVLTPRARQLQLDLPDALQHLTSALRGPEPFDPATADDVFTIATLDYFDLTTLPTLMAHLSEHAPRVRLRIDRVGRGTARALSEGRIDLVLGGPGIVTGASIECCEMYRDPFKVVVRAGHPVVGRRIGLEQYLGLDHVLIRVEERDVGAVDRVLAARGLSRRIGLWVPHFVSAPMAVASSDMISTMASGWAHRARELLDVRVLEPPIDVPAVPVHMYWPRAHRDDPARTWLRELILSGRVSPPPIRKLMARNRRDIAAAQI